MRSVRAALVVCVLGVMGGRLALAQPINGCPNPNMTCSGLRSTTVTATSVTASGLVTAGSLLTNGAASGMTGTRSTLLGSRSSSDSSLWLASYAASPTTANYTIDSDTAGNTYLNAPSSTIWFGVANASFNLTWNGTTLANASTGAGFTSAAASGTNGYACTTEGCRFAIGPDTQLAESGTTIVATGTGGLDAVSGVKLGAAPGVVTDSATAVTLAGGCTSPTITWSNGTALFQFDVGSTCSGVSTITATMPTAAHAWLCTCVNTTASATRVVEQSGQSVTTCVLTNYSRTLGTAADWADGADILCSARGG